jgi:hypothetical protein
MTDKGKKRIGASEVYGHELERLLGAHQTNQRMDILVGEG